MRLVVTKRITEAQFAYCHECGTELGCQYWPLGNSVWLHKRGSGHTATLYKLEEEA